jgi:hypothetical protein
VELDELLRVMDRTAANLARLEQVWARAVPLVPTGPARGSNPEYDDLSRAWADLLAGLPPIDGWTITEPLPDIDELGRALIDYFEIDEPAVAVHEAAEQPGKDLVRYRYLLTRARRRAARQRLQQLTVVVDKALSQLVRRVPRDGPDRVDAAEVAQITDAVDEIERLVGDTVQRRGRWSEMARHLHFGEGRDWHDIHDHDWPSLKPDIEAASFTDTDPLPVPNLDLGHAAGGLLTGPATLALRWDRLDDDGFERLLYDLLQAFPDHQNVQWLTQTRAPDRGRDLSLERVIRDSTGGVRTERVIVQAKHWLSRSVRPVEVNTTLAGIKASPPPVVRVLVIATSGRFTADAVALAEQHNERGDAPYIDLWPDSRLETMLARKPHLAAAHGLRGP